jgi:uncharacterized surface protein with fasciclin (FAS1) repeats
MEHHPYLINHAFFSTRIYAMKISKFAAALGIVAATMGNVSVAAEKDIVETAKSAGSFNTLVTAIQKAGLVETLKGKGPFTVFAPTDEAFAKIPKAQLNALLADKTKLTKVLSYHVVPGKIMAADVKAGSAKTVEGENLTITTDNGGVKVDKANVVKTDVVASNGVIHVIDSVMMPN